MKDFPLFFASVMYDKQQMLQDLKKEHGRKMNMKQVVTFESQQSTVFYLLWAQLEDTLLIIQSVPEDPENAVYCIGGEVHIYIRCQYGSYSHFYRHNAEFGEHESRLLHHVFGNNACHISIFFLRYEKWCLHKAIHIPEIHIKCIKKKSLVCFGAFASSLT